MGGCCRRLWPNQQQQVGKGGGVVGTAKSAASHADDLKLYCTVLCFTVLYCTVLYCTVLYCTALYCTVLYCTVLYCTVPDFQYRTAPKLPSCNATGGLAVRVQLPFTPPSDGPVAAAGLAAEPPAA
jgi:hypothetical protein